MQTTTPKWLRRYTKVVAGATLFLIYAGALVTSTGSGLAVPDWPLSFGTILPPMVGGVFYEHGHRMIAAAVGLLTAIQAVALARRESRPFVRTLGWTALAIMILQAVLGGLTVLLGLPLPLSVSHAALAQIFLCVNVAIAFFTSRSYGRLRAGERSGRRHVGVGWLLVSLVFLQALVGAWMRHLRAGLAIPDFPLSFGRLLPPLSSVGIGVNFAHRIGALLLLLATIAMGARVVRESHPALRAVFTVFAHAIAVQIFLGAFTVWTGRDSVVASFHVMTGAVVLSVAVLFTLFAQAASDPPTSRT